MRSAYQDIINEARKPGKIYLPVTFDGEHVDYIAVEKKDLIEILQARFATKAEFWELGDSYMEGVVLKKIETVA